VAMPAEEEGEEPKQVEKENDHRAGIVTGPGLTDQSLGCRTRFWRSTGFTPFVLGGARVAFTGVQRSQETSQV
jgi:hypothetical protein